MTLTTTAARRLLGSVTAILLGLAALAPATATAAPAGIDDNIAPQPKPCWWDDTCPPPPPPEDPCEVDPTDPECDDGGGGDGGEDDGDDDPEDEPQDEPQDDPGQSEVAGTTVEDRPIRATPTFTG